ncbi:hypothetical protein AOQ84DRAFT_385557 [Glonium stellatum]|uniref:Uncharacterized protein n=1 Tax=Glonium stellatum TaxID=574774 RepID=A0A8E2F9S5_9PEZI|nr:hypothetical protein AOQ84DRAFT_385557 [Glonium stellatum]
MLRRRSLRHSPTHASANTCHTLVLRSCNSSKTPVTTTWQQSQKASDCLSFLELPSEIRNMIYVHIWDHRRKCFAFIRLDPCSNTSRLQVMQTDPGESHDGRDDENTVAMLQTCHQIHAEFCSLVYLTPVLFHLRYPGIHEINISQIYAGFVRTVYLPVLLIGDNSPEYAWRAILQESHAILRMLPALSNIYVQIFSAGEQVSRSWEPFQGSEEQLQQVDRMLKWIRTMYKIDRVEIPDQLFLVPRIGKDPTGTLISAILQIAKERQRKTRKRQRTS